MFHFFFHNISKVSKLYPNWQENLERGLIGVISWFCRGYIGSATTRRGNTLCFSFETL